MVVLIAGLLVTAADFSVSHLLDEKMSEKHGIIVAADFSLVAQGRLDRSMWHFLAGCCL